LFLKIKVLFVGATKDKSSGSRNKVAPILGSRESVTKRESIFAWTDLPLVPFLYGLVFKFFGEHRVLVQILNTIFYSLTVVLTYQLGETLWDEGYLCGVRKESCCGRGCRFMCISYMEKDRIWRLVKQG